MIDQSTHTIRIVKPPPETKGFAPGERIILVNGVRWGRTYVAHHGMHGKSYTFDQDGEGTIMVNYDPPSKHGRMTEAKVRIGGRRRSEETRSTDELVREKAQELINKGLLRDPALVQTEIEKRRAAWRERQIAADAAKKEQFRIKAREALGEVAVPDQAHLAAVLDRLVEAMEWAQSQ